MPATLSLPLQLRSTSTVIAGPTTWASGRPSNAAPACHANQNWRQPAQLSVRRGLAQSTCAAVRLSPSPRPSSASDRPSRLRVTPPTNPFVPIRGSVNVNDAPGAMSGVQRTARGGAQSGEQKPGSPKRMRTICAGNWPRFVTVSAALQRSSWPM